MPRQPSLGALLICVMVGLLFGMVVGEIFGRLIHDTSAVYLVLVETCRYTFAAVTLNSILATATFGFSIGVNGFSLLGILFGFFYWKNRM